MTEEQKKQAEEKKAAGLARQAELKKQKEGGAVGPSVWHCNDNVLSYLTDTTEDHCPGTERHCINLYISSQARRLEKDLRARKEGG